MRPRLALLLSLAWTACSESELVPASFSFDAPESINFDEVAIGSSKRIDLSIRNTSSLAIEIESITPGPGFIGDRYLFRIESDVSAIAPGDTAVVAVLFAPYGEMTNPVESSLSIVTDFETKEVKLIGRGVRAFRVDPPILEFGRVPLNTTRSLDLTITNLLETPLELVAGPIDFLGGEAAFEASALAESIPARETIGLRVEYTPQTRSSLEDRARLPFSTCNDRTLCETVVDLRGRFEEELVCEPTGIDFGAVVSGTTATRETVCTVLASRNISVQNVTSPSTELIITTDVRLPALLAPGQEIRLALAYSPVGLSIRGAVRIDANVAATATPIPPVTVDVIGALSEPNIEVQPALLELGAVSLGTSYALEVLITNTGDTALALTLNAAGPVNAFTVTPSAFLIPSGQTELAVVSFFPMNTGLSAGELVIDSIDHAGDLRLPISGTGVEMMPCQYRLQPETLDFGIVEVGLSTTLPVRMENIGAEDCIVRGWRASGDRFQIERAPAGELLRPGEAQRLLVTYAADARDIDAGFFSFYVSDPRNSQPRVSVTGSGQHDVPIIYPDLLDFGPVAPLCGGDRSVRIHNGRASTLTITELELDASASPGMSINNMPPLPLSLEYGESAELSVHYDATGVAEATGIVRVREDSLITYSVGLLAAPARDANAAVMEERFLQHEDPATDVLFVLDTSCSSIVFGEMAGAFPSFVSTADSENIDYQLAFVDMTYGLDAPFSCVRQEMIPSGYDYGRCGYFFAPAGNTDWKIISRDDQPSPGEAFAAAMQIAESGYGEEWTLENARSALRAPLTLGWNAGLLRQEAELAMIVVENEPEQSIGSVDMYTDAFLRIKGAAHKNRASIHALVGLEGGCQGPFASAYEGVRLLEAARKSGGSAEDYCSPVLAEPMAAFGEKIFGNRATFLLENRPEPMTLEIFVDGQPVPAGSASVGINWTYDDQARAVTFQPAAVPERSAEIIARYHTRCN